MGGITRSALTIQETRSLIYTDNSGVNHQARGDDRLSDCNSLPTYYDPLVITMYRFLDKTGVEKLLPFDDSKNKSLAWYISAS